MLVRAAMYLLYHRLQGELRGILAHWTRGALFILGIHTWKFTGNECESFSLYYSTQFSVG